MFITLPKAHENDQLDGAELKDGVKWSQQVSSGKIEEVKSVKRQWDGNVVDDCNVDVAGVCAPVTIMVVTARLKEDDDEGHYRLHKTELESGLLAEAQKSDCISFAGQAARSVQAWGFNWFATDLWHDVSFAAQVLIAQRQKIVDYKS